MRAASGFFFAVLEQTAATFKSGTRYCHEVCDTELIQQRNGVVVKCLSDRSSPIALFFLQELILMKKILSCRRFCHQKS